MKHARNDGPDLASRLGRRVVTAVADDMSTTQRVGAGVVAALVAISPFGAWNEVEPQADPLATGTPVEVGPFEVTVEKIATADELGQLTPQPGNHLLAVVAEVTNSGDMPEYGVTLGYAIPAPVNVEIVPETPIEDLGVDTSADPTSDDDADSSAGAAPEEPRLPSARIFHIKDGTSIRLFNPGLTYRVALVWEQSKTWSGQTVPLEVVELEWVEDDPLGLDDGHWFPNEVAFQGQIPVQPAGSEADSGEQSADTEAGQQ